MLAPIDVSVITMFSAVFIQIATYNNNISFELGLYVSVIMFLLYLAYLPAKRIISNALETFGFYGQRFYLRTIIDGDIARHEHLHI
mgnify:CR=1 FL=1